MSKVLTDFSCCGAKLTIGSGTIDEHEEKFKNTLYCINYKELFHINEHNSEKTK